MTDNNPEPKRFAVKLYDSSSIDQQTKVVLDKIHEEKVKRALANW